MPRLIYGTAWKASDTANLVELAIRCGFRAFDTACQPKHYNEAGVGEGVARCLGDHLRREDLYLQTKYTPIPGQDPERIPYDRTASLAKQVAQSLEVSLRNLRVDHLDALVLHSPLHSLEQTAEVWSAMEEQVDRGLVKEIGISNCYSAQIFELLYLQARIRPSIVQNRFYADTGYDSDLRAYCLEHDVAYQSFWTLTANPHLLASPRLAALADSYQWTPEQVFFRFVSQLGITPLTGTRSEQHMREDLAIFEKELSDSEVEELGQLLQVG